MTGNRSPLSVDDETLAVRARSDPEAFTALYDRYVDLVFGYCLRRLGTREAAEDATSQTFFKALAAMPRYQADAFRSWLFTIARNVVIDAYRSQRSHQALDAALGVSDQAPSPEEAAVAVDTRRAVRELLDTLPRDQREVIELRLADLTGIEIATARFPSRTNAESSPAPLSTEAAQEMATAFARSRFVAFALLDSLGTRAESIARTTGGLDRGYLVTWRLRDDDSGAWMPTWVVVTVSLDTGQVYAYDTLRHPYAGPMQPVVSRDAAILLVGAATQGDPRYGSLDVTEVFLMALSDDTLQWVINLVSVETSIPFTAAVDATTGEVMRIANGVGIP